MNTNSVVPGELFELLTKATRDAVWNWDLEANTVWWNEGFSTLFGYEARENQDVEESWVSRVHPDDRERVLHSIHQVIDGGGVNWSAEYRFRRSDDTYATVYDRGYILHRDGRPLRMVGAMQDISERVALQRACEESEERLRFALKSAQLGTWELDIVQGIVTLDDLCREIFGLTTHGTTVYVNTLRYIHPDDRSRVDNAIQWALNPESGGHYDVRYRMIGEDDGKLRWIRSIGQALFTETGKAYRFSGIAQDITSEMLAREKSALSERQAKMALEGSGAGSFSVDLATNEIVYSPAFARIVTGEETLGIARDALTQYIHPEDRHIRDKAYENGVQTGSIAYEVRFIWTDGSVHWGRVLGQYLFTKTGKPVTFSGIALDVTEQKEKALALREAEERFAIAFANTSVGMAFTDEQANFTVVNEAYTQLTGYSADELCTLNSIELTHPDDREHNRRLFREVVEGKRPFFNLVKRYIRKDNLPRWVQMNVTRLVDSQDKDQSMVIIAYDISESIEAEAKLRTSEERFRNLIAEAPVAISLFVGRDMVVELPNEKMLRYWGKDASVIGKPLREALPELEGQPFLQILDEVYTTGIEYSAQEAPARLEVGGTLNTYYFNFTYKPLRNAEGQIYAIVDMAIDVTEQVLARQAIEESELRFRTLMEAISQMTWTNTPDGNINFYNQRWYEYTGLSVEEAPPVDWLAMIHPDDREHTLAMFRNALTDGTIFVVENRYRRGSDGMYRWHLNRALPIRDEAGDIRLWVGTATDIHEQKQVAANLEQEIQARTEQLVASNQDLRRSNENLEKFAYIASHDLQEPLRKIQSFGDILKNQYADRLGEGAGYLERMQTAASRMSLLIKDLLTFSRISTRQEAADPVPLNRVVSEVLDNLEFAIRQAGAQIEVDSLPIVSGDESQLRQLFQNLLSNALKFQKAGVTPLVQIKVDTVVASALPEAVKPTRFATAYHLIRIIDNGIGFDDKYIDRIFQVFQRLHNRNEYAGTGIGLAICEKVVANHGGAITATSQLGQGATFIIYLPVA